MTLRPAGGIEAAPVDRRRAERRRVDVPGLIRLEGGRERACRVVDVSATGARLAVAEDGLLPARFALAVGLRRPRPVRVAWREGRSLGVAFEG